jgi:hypothetical protein
MMSQLKERDYEDEGFLDFSALIMVINPRLFLKYEIFENFACAKKLESFSDG